jgi:two-component system phosphate regulon sensor histidine kinase PhoR
VLTNLIENAIKYSPEGARVTVRARRLGDRVRVSVEDNGPGIEARHLGRIFERFYRVDTGRSRALGGTGLGLAIVKHLGEAMEGSVGVDTAAPHGSIFWVKLTASPE